MITLSESTHTYLALKSDNINRLITLSVITLSSFHCFKLQLSGGKRERNNPQGDALSRRRDHCNGPGLSSLHHNPEHQLLMPGPQYNLQCDLEYDFNLTSNMTLM
jgi:hypothetical protein